MSLSQTELNTIYGYQIRLAGLIRRGADQDKIDHVRALYEAGMKKIEQTEKE
jgi:hypothetical protein